MHESSFRGLPLIIPFGIPPAGSTRTVVQVLGNHSLRTDLEAVASAVRTLVTGGAGWALPHQLKARRNCAVRAGRRSEKRCQDLAGSR